MRGLDHRIGELLVVNLLREVSRGRKANRQGGFDWVFAHPASDATDPTEQAFVVFPHPHAVLDAPRVPFSLREKDRGVTFRQAGG